MEHPKSATPPAHKEPNAVFKPYDVLDNTAKVGLVGGASGLFIASIRNALAKTNVGTLSVFTRGAPIIGITAAAPAAYIFFSQTSMNLREQNDPWSAALGGFALGGVLGLVSKRMPVVLGLGASVAVTQGMFYYLGNRYDSFYKEDDTFAR
ncbi:hypothetical protein FDECE_13536, partial [Fusarium decemcellulare]